MSKSLNQTMYLPFDNIKIVEEQIELLDKKDFFQLGQSIIYRLLITYGFKEKVVINFKRQDFDLKNGKLRINCNGENSISIILFQDIYQDLAEYCALNKYEERVYLFTKSNGKPLTSDSILGTLKSRLGKMNITNFTPTSVALFGVAKLIEKGLTISEIKILTGFDTQIIDNISSYLLKNEDVERIINKKLP